MYEARFADDPDELWIEILINGEWNDVHLGRKNDEDADIWKAIADLWIVAPKIRSQRDALLDIVEDLTDLKIYDDPMLLGHLGDLIDRAVAAIA